MNKWLALIGTILLLSCCKDNTYHYPSVKEEFFTAYAGPDSLMQYIITDDGALHNVAESGELDALVPDSLIRLMGYYEELPKGEVKVYSFIKASAPFAVPVEQYTDSLPTAPVSLLSVWLGYRYLNMLVNIKSGGKTHKILFLEEKYTTPDSSGVAKAVVNIYHKDNNDAQVYEVRGYASLPLSPYLTPETRQLDLQLNYLSYEGDTCTLNFEYKP